MAAIIQLKRAEARVWEGVQANYVPQRGEACVSFNTGGIGLTKVKIGDGINPYWRLRFIDFGTAKDIPYNNVNTGLVATDLQDAIDELYAMVTNRQIKTLTHLGISTSQFNNINELLRLLVELPAGRLSTSDVVVGSAPMMVKVLGIDEEETLIKHFIYDASIEIGVLHLDSFHMSYRATLSSQKLHPYNWTAVGEFYLSIDEPIYWRSPLSNIIGAEL